MKIAMGSDHGGIHLKNHLKGYLEGKGYEVLDKGTYTEESCDYPDYAAKVGHAVVGGEAELGILVAYSSAVRASAFPSRPIKSKACAQPFAAMCTAPK